MIKRLIGLLAALCIVAVLVFTVLHRANYRSMVAWGGGSSESTVQTPPVSE